jgi:hypothetical protein
VVRRRTSWASVPRVQAHRAVPGEAGELPRIWPTGITESGKGPTPYELGVGPSRSKLIGRPGEAGELPQRSTGWDWNRTVRIRRWWSGRRTSWARVGPTVRFTTSWRSYSARDQPDVIGIAIAPNQVLWSDAVRVGCWSHAASKLNGRPEAGQPRKINPDGTEQPHAPNRAGNRRRTSWVLVPVHCRST